MLHKKMRGLSLKVHSKISHGLFDCTSHIKRTVAFIQKGKYIIGIILYYTIT